MNLLKMCCLGLFACAINVAWAASLAVAVDVKGDVKKKPAGGAQQTLNILDYLDDKTLLQLGPQSKVQLVSLTGSQEWLLQGPGQYAVTSKAIETVQGAAPIAIKAQSKVQSLTAMESSHKEKLALGAVVMRGDDKARLLGPLDGVILTQTPTLYWTAGQSVRVTLAAKKNDKPILNTVSDQGALTLKQPLAPGMYVWTLSDPSSQNKWASATFEVLSPADPRRAGVTTRTKGDVAAQVKTAALLEQAGFTYDAWLIWKTLAAQRPNDEGLKVWAQ